MPIIDGWNNIVGRVTELSHVQDGLDELKTLNTNLEALAVLLESYQSTGEAIQDIRTMLAGLLGWRVKTPGEVRDE